MALQLWETLKEAIVAYTGLSPATFFTFLALLFAVYYVISGLFGSSGYHPAPRAYEEQMQPIPPPVQVGEITEEELKVYDGSDPKKPLLMAIKGQIYDVSPGRYKAVYFLPFCYLFLRKFTLFLSNFGCVLLWVVNGGFGFRLCQIYAEFPQLKFRCLFRG